MAVPTRPAAGAPIDATWGQVIHDTVGAIDIQTGKSTVQLTGVNGASIAVTFPRPFASAPNVVATVDAGASASFVCSVGNATTTGFTLTAMWRDVSTTTTATLPVNWIAIGARA